MVGAGISLRQETLAESYPLVFYPKMTAWNILENRYYEYDAIRDFFPFLQVVKPDDITKFLWGIEPEYLEQDFTVLKENSVTMSISFETESVEETLRRYLIIQPIIKRLLFA